MIERISRFAREIAADSTVSVGSELQDLSEVARSFRGDEQVANATPPGSRTKSYYERTDINLPELLYALRDDIQVRAFAERQLGPLVNHDAKHGTDSLSSVRHYLNAQATSRSPPNAATCRGKRSTNDYTASSRYSVATWKTVSSVRNCTSHSRPSMLTAIDGPSTRRNERHPRHRRTALTEQARRTRCACRGAFHGRGPDAAEARKEAAQRRARGPLTS